MIYNYYKLLFKKVMGIGDWGLGNPQSPIPNPQRNFIVLFKKINTY